MNRLTMSFILRNYDFSGEDKQKGLYLIRQNVTGEVPTIEILMTLEDALMYAADHLWKNKSIKTLKIVAYETPGILEPTRKFSLSLDD